MSDFDSDSDTNSEHRPGNQQVLNSLIWFQAGDIVRFSPSENPDIFNGEIDSITFNQEGNIFSITIRHLDQKHKGVLYEYPCPYGSRWITRDRIETPAFDKFVDLQPNMMIRTRVANRGVRGWIKSLDASQERYF